jgi:hypothetical protein
VHLDSETEHKAEHQGKAGRLFSLPSSSGSGGTGEVEREPPASAQDGPSASEGDTTMAVVATATTQP